MKRSSFFVRGAVAAFGASAVCALAFMGWSASAVAHHSNDQAQYLPLRMSINELMVAVVDDVAHNIWDGGNKTTPLTANEWLVVDEHSVQLRALATLISMGGTGEYDHSWVSTPAWQEWAGKLRDVGVAVKAAADSKDKMALWREGNNLVNVCEGCHKQFKPALPTEGILHKGHGHSS